MEHEEFIPVLDMVGASDTGRIRTLNEDSFGIDPELGMAVLADGMGGHGNGDLASRTAVEAVLEFARECARDNDFSLSVGPEDEDESDDDTLDDDTKDDATEMDGATSAASNGATRPTLHPVAVIRGAVRRANQRILTLNHQRGKAPGRGMGTTLVGLWLPPGERQAIVFHVGDSRLYRLRGGEFRQLTRDHSMYQAWLEAGARGPAPARNVILRAVGMGPDLNPDVALYDVTEGDAFLLCSDGLSGMVDDAVVAEIMTGGTPATELPAALIKRANENGGRDNVTVILARATARAPLVDVVG